MLRNRTGSVDYVVTKMKRLITLKRKQVLREYKTKQDWVEGDPLGIIQEICPYY